VVSAPRTDLSGAEAAATRWFADMLVLLTRGASIALQTAGVFLSVVGCPFDLTWTFSCCRWWD
jgi:hypothetical protein